MALFAICIKNNWNGLDTLVTTKVLIVPVYQLKSDWVDTLVVQQQPSVPPL